MSTQSDAVLATSTKTIALAAEIVAAYVTKNSIPAAELPGVIASVHEALSALPDAAEVPAATPVAEPAVSVKKSVTHDHIICLDDGKKFRSMTRHLAVLGMTPNEYRAKWNLPRDYPMVAPAYSEKRSALAKQIGLGQPRAAANDSDAKSAAPKRQGRRRKAA